jgi:hypothetical protein
MSLLRVSLFGKFDVQSGQQMNARTLGHRYHPQEATKSTTWRTYQFSDHKPMWVRLSTNDSRAYLENMKA